MLDTLEITTERGPGCTDACVMVSALIPGLYGRRDVLLCNREVHEMYGRLGGSGEPIVRTGLLTVDLPNQRVFVGAQRLLVTRTEWAILADLARYLGLDRTHWQMISSVWGPRECDPRLLRVNINRLRLRLGTAGRLIVTRPQRGYCLEQMPPEGPGVVALRRVG